MSDPGKKSNRRGFFGEGLGWLVGPVANYLDGKIELPIQRTRLRPPGAIPEEEFLDTCYRCGMCVEICPVDAIVALHAPADAAHGTPIIDPDLAACALCEGLQCTNNCPSGALQPTASPRRIRMGLAIVSDDLCVRSHGVDCTKCVDACPLGPIAIEITTDGPPRILDPGCVGCGQCQLHCPTMPKAVTVRPL